MRHNLSHNLRLITPDLNCVVSHNLASLDNKDKSLKVHYLMVNLNPHCDNNMLFFKI